MKKLLLVVFLVPTTLLFPKIVFASPSINEVYPQPNSEESEWIEIYNNSDDIINLSGWILMDQLSSPSIIYDFDQQIEANSYLVIELDNPKLNNSGDNIQLIDSNLEVIDEFNFQDSVSEMSFSAKTNDSGEKEIFISNPTKGLENEIYVDEIISNDEDDDKSESEQKNDEVYPELIISEVMACPTTENSEWIKIFNPNQTPISLNNWRLSDAAENEIKLPETEVILELDSTTIYLKNKILNNSGDNISLYDPNNQLVDQFEYSSCSIGVVLTKTSSLENDQDIENNNIQEEEIFSEENHELEMPESISNTNQSIENLKKINAILKLSNVEKYPLDTGKIKKTAKITYSHKSLSKSGVISVIIGGAIISSSGLFFIKVKNEKS